MPKIELLDAATIDKIAAGEVVESPANVAKEMMENAIDSGANTVTVEIKDGGIGFIRVTDNGCGIPAAEVRTAFLRHATSKIRSINDLTTILSLGFRGEALSSIAAVSKVEIITRTRDSVTGVRYLIEGAQEKSFEEIGAPYGTTIIMRQLFYNTPARAKFLKSALAEGNKVTAFVEQLALSRPDIAFKYIVNGQVKLQTYGSGSLKEAAFHIYGRDIAGKLIPIDKEKEFVRITGFLGTPEVSRGNKGFENYFVNGRYVKSKLISAAIEEGYAGNLMQHRYPFVILSLEIDREKVDVNVHPAKLELRFSRQEEIYAEIRDAVKEAIAEYRVMPKLEPAKEKPEKREAAKPVTPVNHIPPVQPGNTVPETQAKNNAPDTPVQKEKSSSGAFLRQASEAPVIKVAEEKAPYHTSGKDERPSVPELVAERQMTIFDNEKAAPAKKKTYRIIGQVFETYVLVEDGDKLLLIDQHAAHEKVMYEQFMKDLAERTIQTQQLFPAVVINLSLKEYEQISANLDDFAALGFEIEPFGVRTFRITGIPVNLFGTDVKELFTELVDGGEFRRDTKLLASRIATASCKAAVKGNMRLSGLELNALIDELMSLDDPYHCPHGRPTFVTMSKTDLDKKFKRIV